jgi:hypothetical protein
MKVVINAQHGGFGLSREACERYCELKGTAVWPEPGVFDGQYTYWLRAPEDRLESKEGAAFYEMALEDRRAYNEEYSNQVWRDRDVARDDPVLIQVVEELGEKANGRFADLKIVEIPDDVEWQIDEYDGLEWVSEQHRTWN